MNAFDVSKATSLHVWYLGNPASPVLTGTVSLIPGSRRCSFIYDDSWLRSGFSLSPDLQIDRVGRGKIILPPGDAALHGALDDASPDRWGQETIKSLDRPKRSLPFDFLYLAGDRRWGALGISSSRDEYLPYPAPPLITAASLSEANAVIERIASRQPLNDIEKRMLQSGRSPGGAQPKMLVDIDGEEWIAKFPNSSTTDHCLIEYAAMRLAASLGINVPEVKAIPVGFEHVVLSKRFDREAGRRIHALSAKTMLAGRGESYATISSVLRDVAPAAEVSGQRRELFRRMVFNILLDNTDDHTKNHAFLRDPDGSYRLSPAYDIPPQMNGMGRQAIPVAEGCDADDLAAIMANAGSFGLPGAGLAEEMVTLARGLGKWKDVFEEAGVSGADIDYLAEFIDSEEKLAIRGAAEKVVLGVAQPPRSRSLSELAERTRRSLSSPPPDPAALSAKGRDKPDSGSEPG